ncbi:MAG: hypothetical protein GX089_14340 [Fibrobacter sp.]|nr:hypothetical protein [Fibrobacter sp.]
MVGYDSIILPGREGKITPEIKLSGIHNGPFRKSITIISNAKNSPNMTISLGGTLRQDIYTQQSYVYLRSNDNKQLIGEITIVTSKKDLKVTEVLFKPYSSSEDNVPEWQNSMPIYAGFSLTKAGEPKEEFQEYTLSITLPDSEKGNKRGGNLTIKTNHPKKREIVVTVR